MAFPNRKIFDYRQKMPMYEEELSNERISVNIRLSNLTKLQSIRDGLQRDWPNCHIDEPDNYVITVSGYPPREGFGAKDALNIVKKKDKKAVIC